VTQPTHTTISVAHRTITQLLANGRTVRYALAASSDGDVYWRQDTFASAEDPVQPLRWLSHRGPLTVSAVIEALPHCQETIRAWTQSEIDDAFAAADLDEIAQQRRTTAQRRLHDELRAAHAGDASVA
jgi:ABC-type transport system involved in cytochrome c biogenesis ATPase subunit